MDSGLSYNIIIAIVYIVSFLISFFAIYSIDFAKIFRHVNTGFKYLTIFIIIVCITQLLASFFITFIFHV